MKHTLKRLTALILALAMGLCLLCGNAWAEERDEIAPAAISSDISSLSNSDFEIEDGVLVKYSGSDSDVTIPDGVTSIGDNAFYECVTLSLVTIPNSVTSIGNYAFYGCENLSEVIIPDSVTNLGTRVFYGCFSLNSVVLSKNITSIGNRAFAFCYDLKSIDIPNSVVSIGEYAFLECSALAQIIIPDSVTEIGYGAFEYCESLKKVTLSNNLKVIQEETFYDCYALEGIVIPASVTKIEQGAFAYCGMKQIVFKGNAPDIFSKLEHDEEWYYNNPYPFKGVTATVKYPANNSTWTAAKRQNYGGKLTWVADGVHTHSYTSKVTTAATCTKNGVKTYTCSCGDKYTKSIAKTAHTFDAKKKKVVAPTYAAKGYTENTCSQCGAKVKSNYKDKLTVSKIALSSVKNSKSKTMTVKWKKNTAVTGYQIQYSADKTFKKGVKTVTVKKNSTTSATIKKLTKKKTYYVRIRGYKTVGKSNYYSAWSASKSAAIKK